MCIRDSSLRFCASASTSPHSRGFSSPQTDLSQRRPRSLRAASWAAGVRATSAFPTGRAAQALNGNDRGASFCRRAPL
eukprot:7429572-Alexandrium_andersonii.AAC.1